MSRRPLADVLNAFVRSGLAIEHMPDLGDRPVPSILAIRAQGASDPCLAGGERGRFALAARSS